VGTGISIIFEVNENGDCLVGGGTVTTSYNDDCKPLESLVRDAHGQLVTRIVRSYNHIGQLIHEILSREGLELPELAIPEEYRNQITPEQHQAMREQLQEWLHGQRVLRKIERSCEYDDQGRVVRQSMFGTGSYRSDVANTYNEQGDTIVWRMTSSGGLDSNVEPNRHVIEVHYVYEYDEHLNWTTQTAFYPAPAGEPSKQGSTTERALTYY
jgi:hypothetical protein